MDSVVSFARWMPAGLQNAAETGTSVRAVIFEDDIAIWRGQDGLARAWQNRCPHRGMRLSYGIVRENRLTCLYHGWTYDGTGGCAHIPAHPDLVPPKSIRAKAYGCVETGGMIWVARSESSEPPPQISGTWMPCRTMQVNRSLTGLAEVLGTGKANLALAMGAWAGQLRVAGLQGAVLLAVQPMGARGAMLHACVTGPEDLTRASDWIESLRGHLERPIAA